VTLNAFVQAGLCVITSP